MALAGIWVPAIWNETIRSQGGGDGDLASLSWILTGLGIQPLGIVTDEDETLQLLLVMSPRGWERLGAHSTVAMLV